ncbi:FSHD region gene 1 [Leptinotarsa decemlineata]|uniref:FSHD region gene 1 n=1 Tax=Leptinotarsa decemlineata TaxID=7539 RepID=UPI000C2541BF|nr:protein FRG1 homolog [Leptinotarsa decemlineata]
MSEYDSIRRGKLVLKGEKQKSRKRKHKSKKHEEEAPKVDLDRVKHGNWWKVTKIEEISGPIAIEFGDQTYVSALDNGLFTIGAPHNEGDGPSPEEILTAVLVDEKKVAFKSGYNKYLRVEKNGIVTGRSDAIGPMEQWEPVFQDGKMALQCANECFLSIDPEDDSVVAKTRRAGPEQFLTLRSQTVKEENPLKDVPSEEQGNISQIEINYIRKFQKFQDKKLKICTEAKDVLKKAKEEGSLHEAMLDRRSKMKADRYCK